MKSRTSRSLAPRESWSRMVLRKSTASSAFESASVWFWHTRQRSSSATSRTLFSRIGSSAAYRVENASNSEKKTALLTLQLRDERQHLALQDLGRDRADLLEADDAALVDDVGFRHTVDAVVDADLAIGVEEGSLVR